MTGFIYPVGLLQRNYLVFSSVLFFIPTLYSIFCQVFIPFGILSFFTGIASVNFWWFGEANWRLFLDKFVAYITATCYCVSGFLRVIENELNPIIYTIIILSAFLFYKISCKLWNEGNNYWVLYHVGFHIFLVIGKIIIINSFVSFQTIK